MKIALINPAITSHRNQQPPLGLGYIASYLRGHSKQDLTIKIFDENAGEYAIPLLKKFKPEVIGVTVVTPHFRRAIQIANEIKNYCTRILTVVGGPHVCAMPDIVMHPSIDIGVIGEGEETMLEIVDQWIEGNRDNLTDIKGIVFSKNERLIKTPPRAFISDLDKVPFPARDLMKMKEFYCRPKETLRGIKARVTQMMASRGCPYNCRFCANKLLWEQKVRRFSARYVVAEMEHLINLYNLDGIYFQDDTFTLDNKWLSELCDLIVKKGIQKKIRGM